MANDIASMLPVGLTDEEANFVYNAEILGLPTKKAASLAGMPLGKAITPLIVQARDTIRRQFQGNLQVTKEDATFGIKEAIDRARIMSEPMTEIAGWDRLIKLHGLDTPAKIDVNITATVAVLQASVKSMSDADLIKTLGADNIIDVDFYQVSDGA